MLRARSTRWYARCSTRRAPTRGVRRQGSPATTSLTSPPSGRACAAWPRKSSTILFSEKAQNVDRAAR
eukprot:9381123-Lingulodinium_polyedra.AAC.1